jgi:hypothetical protein
VGRLGGQPLGQGRLERRRRQQDLPGQRVDPGEGRRGRATGGALLHVPLSQEALIGVGLAVPHGRQRLLHMLMHGHAGSSSRMRRAAASRVRARNTRLATVPAGLPVMPPAS